MRVLVVGGAGYIGSVMTLKLLSGGHQPIILDDLSTGNPKAVRPGVPFYKGDLSDKAILREVFSSHKVDLVMHFAAKIQVGESIKKPDLYYTNNFTKVLSLFDVMMENNILNFIYSSTAAVYGTPEYLPIDEKHPTAPINPYGKSKLMLENALEDYFRSYGIRYLIFRYFNAAGASLDGNFGESQQVKQNLIPILLQKLEKGEPAEIFGGDWETPDGTCIRDYIHIEDIVEAHLLALRYLLDGGKPDVFNLGSEKGSSVREVIDMVGKVSGNKLNSKLAARREGDPGALYASSAKALSVLGWKAEHSDLRTVVDSAYRWHFNRKY